MHVSVSDFMEELWVVFALLIDVVLVGFHWKNVNSAWIYESFTYLLLRIFVKGLEWHSDFTYFTKIQKDGYVI